MLIVTRSLKSMSDLNPKTKLPCWSWGIKNWLSWTHRSLWSRRRTMKTKKKTLQATKSTQQRMLLSLKIQESPNKKLMEIRWSIKIYFKSWGSRYLNLRMNRWPVYLKSPRLFQWMKKSKKSHPKPMMKWISIKLLPIKWYRMSILTQILLIQTQDGQFCIITTHKGINLKLVLGRKTKI